MAEKEKIKSLHSEVSTIVNRILNIGLKHRNRTFYNLLKMGKVTQADIAKASGLSRQRVNQIIEKYESQRTTA